MLDKPANPTDAEHERLLLALARLDPAHWGEVTRKNRRTTWENLKYNSRAKAMTERLAEMEREIRQREARKERE